MAIAMERVRNSRAEYSGKVTYRAAEHVYESAIGLPLHARVRGDRRFQLWKCASDAPTL